MRRLLVIKRKGRLRMKSRSVLQLRYEAKDKTYIKEYPIRDIDAILVIGSGLYIESSVISVLPSYNIPVSIVAKDSVGLLYNPVVIVSPHYRELQYSLDKSTKLEIALGYIKARINGMNNILRYYKQDPVTILTPPTPTEADFEYAIRLWESQASNLLWDKLVTLLRKPYLEELRIKYGFAGRRPKHPDPFNKTLSIMYAVLYSLATKALLAAGLDPTHGFLHRTRYSTPLTFDYTEMFKPIAIQATIELINKEGVPQLGEDNELTRDSVSLAIQYLYKYLTLRHRKTRKTLYQYIFLKAFCLARHLENKCLKQSLTITWNRNNYK